MRPAIWYTGLISLTLLTIVALGFQNCSDVRFAPTPASQTSVNLGKSCVDSSGLERRDGERWQIEITRDEPMTCPDGSTLTQGYRNVSDIACRDGAIQIIGTMSEPLPPAPVCPMPSLMASIDPAMPTEGMTAQLIVRSENLVSVEHNCVTTYGGVSVSSGLLGLGEARLPLVATQDLTCTVTGKMVSGSTLTAQADLVLNCGQKVKDQGRCREFECKSIVPLAGLDSLLMVPARTAEGACFSVKLLDRIASSSSSLTTTLDMEIVSRNHDGGNPTRNSYLMGRKVVDFLMAGPRTVKLSGSGTSLAPILVDNFVVTGIFPKTSDLSSVGVDAYRAYGTSDSTIPGTNHVLLRNQPLTVTAFATGGTSTIAPLDITASVQAGAPFTLDMRALDCGGVRNQSEIYLLFQ